MGVEIDSFSKPKLTRLRKYLIYSLLAIAVLLLLACVWFQYQNKPPHNFPTNQEITIVTGSSVSTIVKLLTEQKVVRSELLLYIIISTFYNPTDIKASTYVFREPYNTLEIAKKLTTGDFTSTLLKLTHREGESVEDLAKSISTLLPNINEEKFKTLAQPFEGYLFPETYFIPPHFTEEDIIKTLNTKYQEFTEPLQTKITASNLTEKEVITLASIVEREANSESSMKMVAGILLNRLNIDMPLQADASIEYELHKPLGSLTPNDLKIDSPYNTYTNVGLPPTPIGNPGATAIMAVLEPTPSDFFYYITGKDGNFYYATTYEEHKRNIARHLR